VRVVHGLPISWETIAATVWYRLPIGKVTWSSCNRFIAVGLFDMVEIMDAVTLERLHAFRGPVMQQVRWLSFSPDSRSLTLFNNGYRLLTTWDLQTGGQASVIPSTPDRYYSLYFSSAYSTDGKVVAVAYSEDTGATFISTYNLLSRTHVYSHRASEGRIVAPIWTHGESLRFVTVKPGSITIWEVGFTSTHTLTEIESLPGPDDIGSEPLFLPTLSRLAFILREAVLVWDARDSKFLLNFVGSDRPRYLSFSSDGRFFACGSGGLGIHLWKETSTGYVLHQELVCSGGWDSSGRSQWGGAAPLLSPNGESMFVFEDSEALLCRTSDPIASLPIVQTKRNNRSNFILEFSPDTSLAAAARLGDNKATIVDLKSGDTRLTIDTGVKICGLGVTGNTVIVVGGGKIITWEVPAGGCVLNARADIRDSVRTIVSNYSDHLKPSRGPLPHFIPIPPDLNHLAATWGEGSSLRIYNLSAGKYFTDIMPRHAGQRPIRGKPEAFPGVFSTEGRKIIKGGKSSVMRDPSERFLWESPHGHKLMYDGWMVDWRKKRLMWLPHRWRFGQKHQAWNGRFLGLLDARLPEPVILELCE
jgi:WD40 repeat protein